MNRRTFIIGGVGTLGLLAGGAFLAKGALYRKAANGAQADGKFGYPIPAGWSGD